MSPASHTLTGPAGAVNPGRLPVRQPAITFEQSGHYVITPGHCRTTADLHAFLASSAAQPQPSLPPPAWPCIALISWSWSWSLTTPWALICWAV
jgi:hypothetical protein